jgi:DNA-binding FadR family transcriptional regulator
VARFGESVPFGYPARPNLLRTRQKPPIVNETVAPAAALKARPRSPKLAERLAERIEQEVVSSGMPIGTNLGFEPALIAKYGVSRSVLREAISILERGGLVEMLRGRYGGLSVAATPEDAAVNALQNYFSFVDYLGETRIEEILLVRRYLEPIALRLAARRADAGDVESLRALEAEVRAGEGSQVRNARLILRNLFNTCKNPALIVLIRMLNQLSVIIGLYQNIPREALEEHSWDILKLRLPQIEALIGGELHELTELQFRQIELLRKLHYRYRSVERKSAPATLDGMRQLVERLYELTGVERAVRQSDVVAQFILYELWRNSWPNGHNLGFETDLIAWIGTTKATFREALRVLERMGVVTMATGRSGGLLVSSPDPQATLSSARLCLQALGVMPADVVEINQALALASISELMKAGASIQPLQQLLDSLSQTDASAACVDQQFRRCLAEQCGNRIISLITALLAELFPESLPQRSSPKRGTAPAEPHRSAPCDECRAILAAIAGGDEANARRRMIRFQLGLAAAA